MVWILYQVYSVTVDGELKEYTVVEAQSGIKIQKDCDMLIRDERGVLYSAKSSQYFLDKKEALIDAENKTVKHIKVLMNHIGEEEMKLVKIQSQLMELQQITFNKQVKGE